MTTLVLAPGLLCDEFVWQHALDNIVELPCVVADFSTQDSLEQMALDTLDATSGDLKVAGFSMGGRVALQMWRLAPDRIKGIALMDTAAHAAAPAEIAPREALVRLAKAEGMEAVCDAWLPTMVHPDRHNDPIMSDLRAMIMRKSPEVFANQIKALVNRPDAQVLLPEIKSKTLVLCGRQDLFSPLAVHEKMVQPLPNADLAIIEDAGHFALVERPEAVTDELRNWLVKV